MGGGGGAGMYGPGGYGGSPGGYGYMDAGVGGHPPYSVSLVRWKPLAGGPRRQTENIGTEIDLYAYTLKIIAFPQRRTLVSDARLQIHPPAASFWREVRTPSSFFLLNMFRVLPFSIVYNTGIIRSMYSTRVLTHVSDFCSSCVTAVSSTRYSFMPGKLL